MGLRKVRALFLDRDGVINLDHGHVGSRERFEFVPGIFELAKIASFLGYGLFIITNQAGIARGLYSEDDFQELMAWVCSEFEKCGASITKVYHCPHHPDHPTLGSPVECSCRKPAPGLLLRSAREFNIDLDASILVGDKESDMRAGQAAGVGSLIFLGAGYNNDRWHIAASMEEVIILVAARGSA